MAEDKSFAMDTVKGFLTSLGSGDPTPGGGAAASLSSAMGASLLMMVANHTIGKQKYAEFEELNKRVRDEAEAMLGRFIQGMDNDAEAFKAVSAAYGMPRDFTQIEIDKLSAMIQDLRSKGIEIDEIDQEEGMTPELMDQIENGLKAARSAAIGEASVAAAEAPLAVMEDSVAALRLAASLPGCSNKNLLSDVLVATHCLSSGLLSAFYNVEANLPAIRRKDALMAEAILDKAGALIREGQNLAEEVMVKAGKA